MLDKNVPYVRQEEQDLGLPLDYINHVFPTNKKGPPGGTSTSRNITDKSGTSLHHPFCYFHVFPERGDSSSTSPSPSVCLNLGFTSFFHCKRIHEIILTQVQNMSFVKMGLYSRWLWMTIGKGVLAVFSELDPTKCASDDTQGHPKSPFSFFFHENKAPTINLATKDIRTMSCQRGHLKIL
eukprot:TRINITY_DN6572_c0_g2_i2.p1 TRINITY_DN6572_c0_g2~~TRINITY_DN6572_c0_g2_i2.p1  ORF type:complete len:181 (-),score=25.35 TRINITY_DN6572_c0_g2_i2:568-1110(-)